MKIEKGVPIPPTRVGAVLFKYPFGEMKVGDSMVGDNKMRLAAYSRNRTHVPERWNARKAGDGFRVWRTA